MIKRLSENNRQAILDFSYKNEKECLYIIGSLESKDAFCNNIYLGYYIDNIICGLAVFFGRWKSFIANSKEEKILDAFVDYIMKEGLKIESIIPCYNEYGLPILNRLKYYNIIPKKVDETIFLNLSKENFIDFSKGNERSANLNDVNGLIYLQRILNNKDVKQEISDIEKERMANSNAFIIEKDGTILSKAGYLNPSKNYLQIVGVVTHPDFRRQGYGLGIISALCKHFFEKGVKYCRLSTRKENYSAQTFYKKLGFTQDEGEGVFVIF